MRTRTGLRTGLAPLFGGLFLSTPASAQETVTPTVVPDGVRFRIGVAAEGGASIETHAAPFENGGGTGPAFGFQLEIGVQLNHRFGVFAAPECSAGTAGVGCRIALMGDLTLADGFVSIGAGPEIGGMVFVSAEGDGLDGLTLAGGRGRLALHFFERKESDHPRQRALTVGLDLHLDYAAVGAHDGLDQVPSTLLVAPMLTVGYLWF